MANGLDFGTAIGLIKGLGSPDPAVIESAVSDWLDDHPEATTTVQDGSITKAKLDNSLQGTVDDVADLKSQIDELNNAVFDESITAASSTSANYRLNESDGLVTYNLSYKILKYAVTPGQMLKVVSDDRFQFQPDSSGHAAAPTTRIGETYQSGTFIVTVPSGANWLMVSTPNNSAASVYNFVDKISALDNRMDAAEDDIADLENTLIIKSDNLYNPALQTPDTISPHYYYAGVPYSTTQFDATWNCTALIEIEPNTKYTVGLVPAIENVTKPWNAAGAGGFCYDSNGTYISGSTFTSNTFTTPASAKYIRFNYQIINGFSLTELNARCVLVKGETLPESYIPFVDTTLSQYVQVLGDDVAALDARTQNILPVWYKRTGTTVEIGYNYGDGKNVIVTMQEYGGNNLFDIKKAETIAKGGDYETAARTTVFSSPSDCFSPYVVGAVNNIDGDETSMTFTGGQHQYNNTGSGSTPTARTVSVEIHADGNAVADGGKGQAAHVRIVWENRVQGYNTKKANGSGREIIKVIHTAEFDGITMKVSTSIYPLEDVKMYTFYGFQAYLGSYYPNVRYLGSANRLVNTIASSSSTSNSGDLIGYNYQADDNNGVNRIMVGIDPQFDMGRREFATGQNAMFVSYNKCYFSIVRNETTMASGSLYALKGEYRFCAV